MVFSLFMSACMVTYRGHTTHVLPTHCVKNWQCFLSQIIASATNVISSMKRRFIQMLGGNYWLISSEAGLLGGNYWLILSEAYLCDSNSTKLFPTQRHAHAPYSRTRNTSYYTKRTHITQTSAHTHTLVLTQARLRDSHVRTRTYTEQWMLAYTPTHAHTHTHARTRAHTHMTHSHTPHA